MKCKCLIFLLLSLLTTTISAQDIEQVFLSMPTELCPLLSVQQRHEMLEYAKIGQIDSVVNQLGGQSEIRAFDLQRNYLNVAYNANANLELKLFYLSQNADSLCVIGSVLTVCAPICSSVIRFYNLQWQPIKVALPALKATDFISTNDEQMHETLSQLLPPTFVQAHFDEHDNIIFSNQTLHTLSEAEQQRYGTYLQTYTWKWKK